MEKVQAFCYNICFSIDRKLLLLNNRKNFRYLYMPHNHRILLLFCLAFALLFCIPVQALCANPPDYERAKAQLARLQDGRPGANSWQACADTFRKVYNDNPKWNLRVAALFRCGIALEEKAKVTKNSLDARRAAAVYEEAAGKYPSSALADDALFRAAVVYNELLNDQKKARVHLEHIARRYFRADHAKIAAEYCENMSRKKGASPAESSRKGKKEGSSSVPVSVPRGAAAQRLAAQLGLSVRTVVIDPGHGGRDPGTMHNGVVEQDVNLDVARRLKAALEKLGYSVRLTRDRNSWISLAERVRLGRNMKGDLFVSIHVNACDDPSVSGFETYILDFARSSSVSRLAMVENADSGRLGDMDKILTEILTGARTSESRRLAERIQKSTLGYLKKNGASIRDGGVKGAPFFVLVGSSMPSVLVEIGYCSNKREAARLKTSKHRQCIAQGIANGIHSYARSLQGK